MLRARVPLCTSLSHRLCTGACHDERSRRTWVPSRLPGARVLARHHPRATGRNDHTVHLVALPMGGGVANSRSALPCTRPIFEHPPAERAPDSAPRPFGLRFFRPAGSIPATAPVPYRYCPVLQIVVADDGADTPLIALPIAWERTTTVMTDGKSPGIEEFTMDYCGDQ